MAGKAMHDAYETALGSLTLVAAGLVHAWATVYPFVTGTTAVLSLILVGHGVCRLFYRLIKGLPIFTDFHDTMYDRRNNDG